jgi:hypothetical protein
MLPRTTAAESIAESIPAVPIAAPPATMPLEWPHALAAYLLPTLAVGAGCWLALALAARLLATLVTPGAAP